MDGIVDSVGTWLGVSVDDDGLNDVEGLCDGIRLGTSVGPDDGLADGT